MTEFEQHRSYLFAIAYRMLGCVSDAEDMVQEAFVRWQQAALEQELRSSRAYLTRVVTRLCMEHLRKAHTQRETYVGPWLPEPLLTSPDDNPEEHSEKWDTISTAFLLLLETLSPVERAVFLLREVFDYSYREIASIVEKSEANCRQIARRAQHHLQQQRPRFTTDEDTQRDMMMRFVTSCMSGDMDGLVTLLADDVVFTTDGGGEVTAARRPIVGADRVVRFIAGLLRKTPANYELRPALVNGEPGLLQYSDGVALSVLTIALNDDRKIQAFYSVSNPHKLAHLPRLDV